MKKIQGKQIQDSTIEQRSMKVLKETITDNNSVTNKEYVLEKVNQSLSGLYQSKLNLNMTASGATVGELACENGVIEFPLSPVMVKLNGILMSVGSDKDFYFSPDGGTTKREGGFAEKGDKLYWNSSEYNLDEQDEIDLVYLVGYEHVDGISGSVTVLDPIYKSIVVKFDGGLSETMFVVLNGSTIEVGNINGQFVWNIDDPIDEHTFTQVGESYVSTIGGEEYTIWFDGFGSLIFSVRKNKKNNIIETSLNVENANNIVLKDLGLVDMGNDNFLDFNGTYNYAEFDEGEVVFSKIISDGLGALIGFFPPANAWIMGYGYDSLEITHMCFNGDINNLPLTGWFVYTELSPEMQTLVSSVLINGSEIHADVVNQLSETKNIVSILANSDPEISYVPNDVIVIIYYTWLGSDVVIFDGKQSWNILQTYEIPDNAVGYVQIHTGYTNTSWFINGQQESHGPHYINQNVDDNLIVELNIPIFK